MAGLNISDVWIKVVCKLGQNLLDLDLTDRDKAGGRPSFLSERCGSLLFRKSLEAVPK